MAALRGRVEAENARRARLKWRRYYPDEGPLRRELYARHLSFFAAGPGRRQRLMLAANRVGKTEGVGAYETTLHLTGEYPDWWEGRRWTRPISAWAAGDTSKTVRDIIQAKLLGPPGAIGTGMIPGDAIIKTTVKAGISDAIDTVWVRHRSGGHSVLVLKSYDQRREAFQGTEQDLIWLDEEPPADIHTESLLRTMTNDGALILTFTPLNGLTELVLSFLPGGSLAAVVDGVGGDRDHFVCTCTWDDVPHLSKEVREELWRLIPPNQQAARSKGIPALGSGAIYPVAEDEVAVADFPIPAHWPRVYALDVGWNRTAGVWLATNPETRVSYLYSEHYRGEAEPAVHAEAIRARGKWITGVIDPAARGRSQVDGRQLLQQYIDLGLKLQPAENAVESGLFLVWQALSSGNLKVFRSLQSWFREFRLYRRDDKGRIVKENDHLMDCTRYVMVSGRELARTEPAPKREGRGDFRLGGSGDWMG